VTRASGLVLGAALVLAAALVNLARWARAGDELWSCVLVLSTLAGLQLASTAAGASAGSVAPTLWAMLAAVAALSVAVGLSVLRPAASSAPPLVIGTGLGLAAAVFMMTAPAVGSDYLGVRTVVALALWLIYVAAAVVVHRHWAWDGATRTAATVAVLAVGAAESFRSLAGLTVWTGTAAGVLKLVAAALLTGAAYVVVRNDLLAHRRHIHTLRHQLVVAEQSDHGDLLQQHSLRNLVAGISMAAELLEDDELEEPTRRRFEHRIHLEAQELCHLIEERTATPRPLRLLRPPVTDGTHPYARGTQTSRAE
jgi:signal transduction histidine kinase